MLKIVVTLPDKDPLIEAQLKKHSFLLTLLRVRCSPDFPKKPHLNELLSGCFFLKGLNNILYKPS